MPKKTSIDEVAQAVEAVKQMQEQIAGLLTATVRLTARLEAVERRLDAASRDA